MSIASRALDYVARAVAPRVVELGRGGPPVGQVFDSNGGANGRSRRRVSALHIEKNPQRLLAIFDRADRGQITEVQDAYEDARLHDPRLNAVCMTRTQAIGSRPWVVMPPPGYDKDRQALDVAANVTTVIHEMRDFAVACGHLGSGALGGIGVLELDWYLNRRGWRVPRTRWIHPNRLCVDEQERVAKCDPGVDSYPGTPLSDYPGKFVVHTPVSGHSTYISRRGALRPLLPISLAKRFGLRWWLQLLERWGQPQVYAKGPTGAGSNLRDVTIEALRRLSEHWQAYFAQGVEIGTIPMSGAVNDELHAKFVEAVNLEIAIGVLGQNLTTEVQGGSYAAANVADQIRRTILESDLVELDETLTDQLIALIVHYNWPGAPAPYIKHLVSGQQVLTAEDFQTRAFKVREFRAGKGFDPIGSDEDERFYEPPQPTPAVALLPPGAPPAPGAPQPPALPADATTVSEAALNGAQVASLMAIVQAVAAGQMPRDTGIEMITAAFPIDRERADRIMGEVGRGFVPAPPPSAGGAPSADPFPTTPPTTTGSASSPTTSTSTSPLARALSRR